MSPEAARAAAELLLKARGDHRKLDRLPEDCTPKSVADGDAIQDALAELWGLEVSGWKVGAASEAAMAMLKTDAPFAGRVFAPYLLESPAEVSVSALHKQMVECEFAFRLGRDLPPRAECYTHEEVLDAVDAAYPAIEIVNDYWVDGFALGVAHLVADNGSNGGLVLGPPIPDWRGRDLAAHRVTLSLDGAQAAEGQGSAILGGDPTQTLAWLANDLSRRGIGMTAGQVTTTGTVTGMTPCKPGQTAVGDYGDAGTVSVTFGP